MKRSAFVACVCAMAMLMTAPAVYAAPQTVGNGFAFNAKANMKVSMEGCTNKGGPLITIDGTLLVDGISATLTFTNKIKNLENRGQKTVTAEGVVGQWVEILGGGEEIYISKSPAKWEWNSDGVEGGGVGGNPHIWFQLDGGDPEYLGRCVQGLSHHVEDELAVGAAAFATLQSQECTNKSSKMNVSSQVNSDGVTGKLILANNLQMTHWASADAVADFGFRSETVLQKGWGRKDGTGGNPNVWMQILTDSEAGSTSIFDEVWQSSNPGLYHNTWGAYVGRCKDLL